MPQEEYLYTYENIYNYQNYNKELITLFFILLFIYLFVILYY